MNGPGESSGMRALPSVDRILREPGLQILVASYARQPVVRLTRRVLQRFRQEIAAGNQPPSLEEIADAVRVEVASAWRSHPQAVLNASGVVLHTNLGRAPLAHSSVRAMDEASGHSDVEVDLRTGRRESRDSTAVAILRDLTGAEDGTVVTNNAAAVLLVLSVLAKGRDVIVSRGHAVEIGGGFRIPSILQQSGARLVEVGTTNRTRVSDYEEAVTPRTGAILHVHPSNFKLVGFTEEPGLAQLTELAHRMDLPLVADNGSGALLDTAKYGLAHEPTLTDALEAGVDIVCFSGDKLLGGPQAGIIMGLERYLARISRHPLARAMRPDKTILAALSDTLLYYLENRAEELPVWRMISASVDTIATRASSWADRARQLGLDTELIHDFSSVGGGSLPGESLPTVLVALPRKARASALRRSQPAVVPRTRDGRLYLDLRTVLPEQDEELLQAVCQALRTA